jgi:hypothetical protein
MFVILCHEGTCEPSRQILRYPNRYIVKCKGEKIYLVIVNSKGSVGGSWGNS